MKKTYTAPSCHTAAVATCRPIATSADNVRTTDQGTTVDTSEGIDRKQDPIWSGAKHNSYGFWDDEED